MIKFQDVSKRYENTAVLRKINLHIEKGEMAYITGPSGAGKSTLLKLIFLEEWPDEGLIHVDRTHIEEITERDVPRFRRKIGVVFQDFRLLDRTVFDNVALTLRIRGYDELSVRQSVHDTLKMVNLRHKSDSYPKTLSGGEQQRVAIARAIIGDPTVLLADEPTGNLDPDTAAGIVRIFKEINARGTTILHATHNRDLFRGTGYRVFRLDGGYVLPEVGL